MDHKVMLENYWADFLATLKPDLNVINYDEAWAFGDTPELADELLNLVLNKFKSGTSSAYEVYQVAGESLPQVDTYSIILDGQGLPGCVVKTTKVEVLPFSEVTATQAAKEGEGDLSLTYWRQEHQTFWERNLREYDLAFSPEMLVVYEEFEVVYPVSE